jgi:hypothetical protein
VDGILEKIENQDGLSASIVELDLASVDTGWAVSVESDCASLDLAEPGMSSLTCSSSTRLLRTEDGGLTWQSITLPHIVSAEPPAASSMTEGQMSGSISTLQNTEVFIGQGFDRCEIPTLSQMQTWSHASPYRTVNLYIGGSSRACSNNALTSAYLFLLNQQGWKFIPTWVGPQAPCTLYRSRMSSDVSTAYQQGVAEASLAVDRLAALGLTDPTRAGSVVYYDIEPYGTNTACRNAVNAFMNGWVSHLHAEGNQAGVYGSTLCNTALSDFMNIANAPDAIWAARWYNNLGEGYYNPNASVWNLGSCIPNTAWASHQRIRQYEGDHYETWGNLTLDIDSNVLDGVVAVPHNYPFVSRVTRSHSNPTNAASVAFSVTFSKPVTGVDGSDFSLSAGGVTGASIGTVTGSGTTYTVTVNTGSGDGTIRLNVLDNNSIVDAEGQPLGGINTGGGNFTYGEIYTVLKSADVAITIGRNVIDGYVVPIGTSLRVDFPAVDDGPVKVTHMKGRHMTASLRAIWKVDGAGSSYSELMGMPAGQLSTEYYFPWYNNIVKNLLDEQFRFANADTTTTTIEVSAGRQVLGTYELDPGESMRVAYEIDNGPIRIRSTDGKKIIASMRAVWKLNGQFSSYSELMGLPREQLSSDYYFPWYNNVVKSLLDQQFRFGNVDTTSTTVQVLVGSTVLGTYSLDPGESMRVAYEIDNGPIRIRSLDGKKIIAAMRAVWKWNGQFSSYSELMGLPAGQLSSDYYFPWYENAGPNPLDEQFRFANVDSAATTIQVSRGATILGTYELAAGQSLRQSFNLENGPIRVRSLDGRKIIAAKRSVWLRNGQFSSYSEMMGLPAGQLSTDFYFPWYNNAVPSLLDEQFRLGVP